jgi:hypothetical protein
MRLSHRYIAICAKNRTEFLVTWGILRMTAKDAELRGGHYQAELGNE